MTWNDIDFNNYCIKINKQVTSKIPGQGATVTKPKISSSIRNVQIPKVLNLQLKKWNDLRKSKKGFKGSWQVFGDV